MVELKVPQCGKPAGLNVVSPQVKLCVNWFERNYAEKYRKYNLQIHLVGLELNS